MFVSSGEIGSLESLPAFDERAADIRQEWSRPRVGATLCVDRARCTWNIIRYQNYLLKGLASFSPLIQTRGLGQLTIYIHWFHLSFVTSCDILWPVPVLCAAEDGLDVYSRLHERTSFWGYELACRGSGAGHPQSGCLSRRMAIFVPQILRLNSIFRSHAEYSNWASTAEVTLQQHLDPDVLVWHSYHFIITAVNYNMWTHSWPLCARLHAFWGQELPFMAWNSRNKRPACRAPPENIQSQRVGLAFAACSPPKMDCPVSAHWFWRPDFRWKRTSTVHMRMVWCIFVCILNTGSRR